MTKELKYEIIGKIREMISAPMCCNELKVKAEEYLTAVGTTREDKKFRDLIDEIKADIIPVDAMVKFMGSPQAVEVFGEEKAKDFYAHAKMLEANGAQFCDCPACTSGQEILKALIK